MVLPAVGATEGTNTGNAVVNNPITDHELKIGMTGAEVTNLQLWLQNQGFYKGKIDGNFGTTTEQAVKAFQQYVGIKEDGIVGSISLQSMEALVNGNIQSQSTSYSKTGSSSKKAYASNKYSSKSSSKSYRNGWSSGRGYGDCWDNSYALYGQLTSSGMRARIVQYANGYVNNHRSVQVYQNGQWVDYDYKGNGYSNRYYAQGNKPGMSVIQ